MLWKLPFSIEEQKKSNTLISGANHSGKSRLAMSICSLLQRHNWKVIVVDNSGIWKQHSDILQFYQIKGIEDIIKMPFPTESIIYDTSLLIPSEQRDFIESLLNYIWSSRVNSNPNQWLLLALEEMELIARNVRGLTSEQLLRIMSVGRNLKIRTLGITIDLALIDPVFIRLCSQRYYGKLNPEENSKRKFKAYHGKDWLRIATEALSTGDFVYYLNGKLKVKSIPLFEATTHPKPYMKAEPQKQPLLNRILNVFKR